MDCGHFPMPRPNGWSPRIEVDLGRQNASLLILQVESRHQKGEMPVRRRSLCEVLFGYTGAGDGAGLAGRFVDVNHHRIQPRVFRGGLELGRYAFEKAS